MLSRRQTGDPKVPTAQRGCVLLFRHSVTDPTPFCRTTSPWKVQLYEGLRVGGFIKFHIPGGDRTESLVRLSHSFLSTTPTRKMFVFFVKQTTNMGFVIVEMELDVGTAPGLFEMSR